MKGMNATTGRSIESLDHLYQSIGKILTTPIGSRVARRTFGSDLFNLVDAPNNGISRVRLYAAIATALMRWEPRLVLTSVLLSIEEGESGQGVQFVDIEGYTTETGESVSGRISLKTGATA